MDFLRGTPNGNGYSFPNGYNRANDDWFTPQCMGLIFGKDPSQSLWGNIASCFGNSGSNQNRLALVNSQVNGKKEKFFGLDNPDPSVPKMPGNNNAFDQTGAHQRIFATGGVFTYMNDPAIWAAYQATSLCIEKALWNFAQPYLWGTMNGELVKPADGTDPATGAKFKYGLRSLYTGWIDAQLKTIESNARSRQTNAKTAYTNAFPPANNAVAKGFLDNIMGGNGKFTAAGMKFPISAASNKQSKYGVWGGSNNLPAPF